MEVLTLNARAVGLIEEHRIFLALEQARRWQAGQRIRVHPLSEVEPYTHILQGFGLPRAMGAFSYSHSALHYFVKVGRYCSIGAGVHFLSGEHPTNWVTTSPVAYDQAPLVGIRTYVTDTGAAWSPSEWSPPGAFTQIGNDVWVGDQATIAQGVVIGDGAIIGARSLVLDDVPPYAVAVGSPATVKRYRFDEKLRDRLGRAAWWRYRPEVIQSLPVSEPAVFLEALDACRPQLEPMAPRTLTVQALRSAISGSAAGG